MPPEMFSIDADRVELTTKADVYAAGVIMWQAMTRTPPFQGLSSPQVVLSICRGDRLRLPPDTTPAIRDIFERCTAIDPQNRPDFAELLQMISAAITSSSA
mmetsp:Transcript_4741/g.10715  ORF Transcript_4741/g.10715 Transcript_4741/m.10715 type:complete len:101 (-) Transcript_4741:106-408(-)